MVTANTMPLQKSCPKLSSLLLIVVHILSINHTRKKGFLKRNDPYLVASANNDRWPQDLLTWHLYLAGDLPPTSLSALHNVHPPLPTLGCSPAKLCVRLLLPYLATPSFNAEGAWVSQSVIWTRIPHILNPHPTNICQSLTFIGSRMYWDTMETNLYRYNAARREWLYL